jgi:hypothetical protein
MCTEREAEEFLKDFIFKLGFWGLLIRTDRTNPKNIETILALGLKRTHVREILGQLRLEDYSQGPYRLYLLSSCRAENNLPL